VVGSAASRMAPCARGHIPELDGLRGTAILMVLLFHGFALSMQNERWTGIARWVELGTRFGWAGVDLFCPLRFSDHRHSSGFCW